ncbi:Serine/threonine-protein kinase STY8 [Phytophthora citrophthora]|uniref:Serine/threonine-protein kinase STY8 n=1 Tax=Phytophthora citrophthora TaxID=4793 RepID=A0AAD9GNG9_9STRA|nr:Serine/threonine-protein kinase STY8 [Phytophthora citrophthora]
MHLILFLDRDMAARTSLTTTTSAGAGTKRILMIRPMSGSIVRKGGHDLNRFGIKTNNSVYPVASISHSLVHVARLSTTGHESIQTTKGAAPSPSLQNYVVKVRVLHGIDLHIPAAQANCQHAIRPELTIAVNGSLTQSCTAAHHARNHSIWKKHELKFHVSSEDQEERNAASFISMHVSLACAKCSCSPKVQDKGKNVVGIGEVGELQFPTKDNEDYEISRFFPVIRRQQNSQSSFVLLPAGKIKLWVRVEIKKSVTQPEIPKRLPFALPTNFGEALQMKRKQLKATVVPENNSQTLSTPVADPSVSAELLKEIVIEASHDRVDTDALTVEHRVGEGIHSCVSAGVLRIGSNCSTRQVAVKDFRYQQTIPPVNVLRAFQQEYRILAMCRSQNGHQHVVELIGVILEPRLAILMEFFSHGSLAQCLHDESTWCQVTIKQTLIDWYGQKVSLGLKIAQGLAWMHQHDIIHRDIKPHNILVGDDLTTSNATVKVSSSTHSLPVTVGDLGSAVVWHQHEPLLVEEVGSSGYTAPEIFMHQGYDNKVDVWSFGIVLWELFSSSSKNRVNPLTGMVGEEYVGKVQSGCRPSFVHTHQFCIKPIVEKCWKFDPSQRPSMDEVVIELENLYVQL